MKKWQKKSVCVLLLATSLGLAACNKEGAGSKAKLDENGKIVMTIGQQTQQNSKLPDGDSYADNAYRRIIEEKLDVKVESAFEAQTGDDYNRQVSLAIASGDLPDVMVVSRDEFEELANNDLIADLTDVYDEYASDYIKEIYSSFDNFQLNAASIDDRLMALPGTSNDFGPNMVWVRQDWVDNLGLKLDADGNKAITLTELETMAKAFIEKDFAGTGKTVGMAFTSYLTGDSHGGSANTATAIFNAYGAYPKNYLEKADGTLQYGSNTPEMKEGLAYLNGLFKAGVIDPQFGTRSWDDITALMVNGELGILPGPWHLSDWYLIQGKSANAEANFVPYAIEDSQGKVNGVDKPGVGGFVVVSKEFSNPEKVVEMVNLLFDQFPNAENQEKEYPELYSYTKATVDGSVRPVNIELFKNLSEISDAVEATEAGEGKIPMDSISNFTVKSNALMIEEYLNDPAGADSTVWSKYASRDLAVTQVMDGVRQTGIFNEVKPVSLFETVKANERNGAQVAKLEEETFIKFITGEESLDKFDDYVNSWNSQGGSEILTEMNELLKASK